MSLTVAQIPRPEAELAGDGLDGVALLHGVAACDLGPASGVGSSGRWRRRTGAVGRRLGVARPVARRTSERGARGVGLVVGRSREPGGAWGSVSRSRAGHRCRIGATPRPRLPTRRRRRAGQRCPATSAAQDGGQSHDAHQDDAAADEQGRDSSPPTRVRRIVVAPGGRASTAIGTGLDERPEPRRSPVGRPRCGHCASAAAR